jgi:hypothetical protein
MRVVPPITTTEAMVTSSSAAEPGVGEAAWASGTTYGLGDKAILGAPSSTVTITIASPGVVTWNSHGLPDGTIVVLSTSGALPTGLAAATVYYVVNSTVNTFQLSATLNGAAIVTTGSQSGVQTATAQVHRIYESLQAANLGNPPALLTSATWWEDIGPTNKWAMFDTLRNTATQLASPLTVVITPGQRVDSIALLGLVADSATITMTSVTGGGTVYSYTQTLSTREVSDWYAYFFAKFSTKPSVVLFDLPPYTDAVITVTLTRSTGYVSCGALVLGTNVYVGRVLHQAENDALNFSTIDRDLFGSAVLVQRRTVPKVNVPVRFTKSNTQTLLDLRVTLNAVPAVWAGLDTDDDGYFGAFLILGVYKQFKLTADQPDEGMATIEVEEI